MFYNRDTPSTACHLSIAFLLLSPILAWNKTTGEDEALNWRRLSKKPIENLKNKFTYVFYTFMYKMLRPLHENWLTSGHRPFPTTLTPLNSNFKLKISQKVLWILPTHITLQSNSYLTNEILKRTFYLC